MSCSTSMVPSSPLILVWQMQFHPSKPWALFFQAGRGLCGGQAVNHERELIVVHLKLQGAPD